MRSRVSFRKVQKFLEKIRRPSSRYIYFPESVHTPFLLFQFENPIRLEIGYSVFSISRGSGPTLVRTFVCWRSEISRKIWNFVQSTAPVALDYKLEEIDLPVTPWAITLKTQKFFSDEAEMKIQELNELMVTTVIASIFSGNSTEAVNLGNN